MSARDDTLRIATRASTLALTQTRRVAARLEVPTQIVRVTTRGDRDRTTPLHEIGGQGVFVKEVQRAVLDGVADIAVHSAKDLPARTPDGLVLAAVPERADPRDALVGATLDSLAAGAVVGTDAVRRRAQLAALRPDLEFGSLRGNIETRLGAVRRLRGSDGDADDEGGAEGAATLGYDAVVVAMAALERLGLLEHAAQILEPDVMLPQVGQGALAVECRADDTATLALVRGADDAGAHRAVAAERAFLGELGGGCELPCGALAAAYGGHVRIDVLLASVDGSTVVRARVAADGPGGLHAHDPVALGRHAARVLLDERGGRTLLDAVTSPGSPDERPGGATT